MKSPKEEFIDLLCEIHKKKGLDELSSKLLAILYIEPGELSLEELAERTGYSLSSVSSAMKLISKSGIVKKARKPGSRKLYFYMEKNIVNELLQTLKKTMQEVVLTAKERVPKIIRRYKAERGAKEELKIIENYYKQLLVMEGVMKKVISMFEKVKQ